MASFNSCTFTGRVGADPECRYFEDGKMVAKFNLAVDQYAKGPDKGKTLWIGVTVWGKRAQTVADYVKKGSSLLVSGELNIEEWTKEGVKNTKPVIKCSQFVFLDAPRNQNGRSEKPTARQSAPKDEDYDVPF